MDTGANLDDAVFSEGLPALAPGDRDRLLKHILKGVSRAFYLTLRILPGGLREPVGLAYLLARAADTIADTRALAPDERLARLLEFRAQVEGPACLEVLTGIGAAVDERATLSERELLASLPNAFSMLESLPEPDQARVRSVVVTLTRGMEMDLTIFPPEASGQVGTLKTAEELDRYTYLVAGCVGEFWTEITRAHTPALNSWDPQRMSELGVRFGKALQLTNLLRDVPGDLRMGRCYLPQEELRGVGLNPDDLLRPDAGPRARSVLVQGIRNALDHYQVAERYLYAVPARSLRLRLAVSWPLLMGLATLGRLARNRQWLDPKRPSKVSRSWVYRMMLLSVPCAFSNGLLRAWVSRLHSEVEKAL